MMTSCLKGSNYILFDTICFMQQIFKGNILLQSTLSDGSLAVKLKVCDFGFSKDFE